MKLAYRIAIARTCRESHSIFQPHDGLLGDPGFLFCSCVFVCLAYGRKYTDSISKVRSEMPLFTSRWKPRCLAREILPKLSPAAGCAESLSTIDNNTTVTRGAMMLCGTIIGSLIFPFPVWTLTPTHAITIFLFYW